MEKLMQRLAELGLESYYERTKHYLRNAIHMEYTVIPEREIPVGASKLGGHPDLPAEFEWPRQEEGECLLFLLQLNLAELAPYDLDGMLPREGMLYFFYDVGPMPSVPYGDPDGWAVRYYPGSDVTRQCGPEDVKGYFASARPEFATRPEIPFLESDLVPREALEEGEYWKLGVFRDNYASKNGQESDICHKLLGHARSVQTYGMESICEEYYRKHHEPDGYSHEEPRYPHSAERWVNLLQLDSCSELYWVWDEGYGRVYFWIEAEDLKNRRFDRVLAVSQTS